MEEKNVTNKSVFIAIWTFALVMAGLFIHDGTTGDTFALTTPDCRVCHTGGTYGNVAARHHAVQPDCAICHGPIGSLPLYECLTCHYPGTTIVNASNITQAHGPLHDNTDVPSPDCSPCHIANVTNEHDKYPLFDTPNGELDCARCHSNTNTDPALGPIFVQENIAAGTTGQMVYCDDCHTNMAGGTHAAVHDNVFADSTDCTTSNCHAPNVMTEHLDRGWSCNTCHNGETLTLDPELVQQVIADASSSNPNPQTRYCSSCHGPDAGMHIAAHDQAFFLMNPPGQDCSRCHAANPAPNSANLTGEHITSQNLTCATCHGRDDYVFDAINKGRSPSNQPVYCLDCHADSGQGEGHPPVVVDPWSECTWCHAIDVFGTPEIQQYTLHNMHLDAALDMQQDCSVCHAPEGTRPNCILCHSLDQTMWDPLPVHRTAPNNSLDIIGPGTEDHDRHTSGLDCSYCHLSGIPGSEPLPAPYDQCSTCHSAGGPGTDIMYGSYVHTSSHIAEAEARGQGCSYCHSATPACTECHDIAGPNTAKHDIHTDTLLYDCTACHLGGIAGSEPLPEPYDQCSSCHNPAGPGSDIIYGSLIHTDNHIAGGEASGLSCALCHGPAAPDCSACHAPGHPPIPAPYNECSACHNGSGTTTDIMFGQAGHNTHMTAAGNNCTVCHNDQPDCSSCHAPGHPPVPAPYSECDQCHDTLQPGQATHQTHRLQANQDCTVCHTTQPDCSACHVPGHPPVPAPYNECDQCHDTLQPGQATHQTHRLQANQDCTVCHTAQPDCSACHVPSHPPVPAPYNECDQCHATLQPGQATHDAHRLQANQDCTVCHTAQPDCSACHTAQAHGPIPAPYNECSNCHTGIVYGQAGHTTHMTAAGNNCAACHNDQPDCSACHAPGHPPVPAPYNACDQCHATLQPGQATHQTHRLQANQDCTVCHNAQPDCSACHVSSHPAVPAPYNECDQCHDTLQPGQATHDIHRLQAGQDCTVCHNAQPDCSACHVPSHPPVPAPYNECDQCHDTLQPGQATHDAHRLQANQDCTVCHNAQPDCSACHVPSHPPVPAPYNECDQCHDTLQPGQATHDIHRLQAGQDCTVCHTAQPDCGQCHTADSNHEAAHDSVGVPSPGCTNCHDANVVVEHVTDRPFTCATCHDSTDPNVIATITAGKAGTFVTCYDCHGQNQHHSTSQAQSGNCTHCHTDPRPLVNDPQQLACRECHLDSNGYVQTSAPSPSHAYNTMGDIQDFGACFDCHTPAPYHAKPPSWPGWYEEIHQAPGRGIFNVFKNELQPSCAGDCENILENRSGYGEDSQPERNNDRNWRIPVSFTWFPIVYQGQSMNMPAFDPAQPFPPYPHDRINVVGNCGDCHTVGAVVAVTHGNNCQGCHLSQVQAVQNVIAHARAGNDVNCFDCHGDQGHDGAHDMTVLPEQSCEECHVANVFAEHVANRQLACSACHDSTDPNVVAAIIDGQNGLAVSCEACHGQDVANHEAAHDNAGVPSTGCTNCHAANVVVEHVANRSYTCATCHNSTASNVISAINAGKSGTFVACYDCHGQNMHHNNTNATTGNCTYCHSDSRLELDPNAPTGQLACRQCHVGSNGFVNTGSGTPSHAFNTQGSIQDFGACFACHQPAPYHAKPTRQPSDCNASTSGKGTFNLFSAEFGGRDGGSWGGRRGERSESCDGRERNYRNPTISFDMVTIFDYFTTNRQWSVPTFGSGSGSGGGGSQTDSVTITSASYSSRSDRLAVYAVNALGNNATLTVSYNNRSYPMSWSSSNSRWSVSISTSSCNDSTIEVVSSAGGSDSSSVSNCSSGSWGH